MKKLKQIIGIVKKGLKKSTGANLDVATIQARWDAIRQLAASMFSDDPSEYDKFDVDPYTRRDLFKVSNVLCKQQDLLSTEYSVNRKNDFEDWNVKLAFNKEHMLCEADSQFDFLTWKTHENLQAKFFFNVENELTKVSYRNKCVYYNQNNRMINKTDTGAKVIDLMQKQTNREAATEMTK